MEGEKKGNKKKLVPGLAVLAVLVVEEQLQAYEQEEERHGLEQLVEAGIVRPHAPVGQKVQEACH